MMEKSPTNEFNRFDENYKIINEMINKAAEKSGRKSSDITLLAATKTVSPELIRHAITSGITAIGENRVQEFLMKYEVVYKNKCDSQFIGRLQSNKVSQIVGKVSCIQSVDSLKLAKIISQQSVKNNAVTKILIEVNIGEEESKGGVMPEELYEFLDEIRLFPNISVDGLMAIPPIYEKKSDLCASFSAMMQYYVDIRSKKIDNIHMNCLSMGMSSDFSEAIECGATLVRIGSALFGVRGI